MAQKKGPSDRDQSHRNGAGAASAWQETEVYLAVQEKVPENVFNADYLRRLKSGDPDVEAHFYSYFRKKLMAKLCGRRILRSEADDIISDTFLRVLRALQKDEIRQPESLGAYVSGVCDNVLREKWRQDSQHPDIDLDGIDVADPAPTLETLILRKERRKIVEELLNALPPKHRNLLRAKIFEQLSHDEMCTRYGPTSPDTLRLVLWRARKQFADLARKRGLDFYRD